MSNDKLLPALIVGGDHGCLSIARNLGAAGIPVYAINHPQAEIRYSRFCNWVDISVSNITGVEGWAAFLLGRESDYLQGAVLLAASDEAIELVETYRDALSKKFVLDLSNQAAQRCMLDKLQTYRAAQAAGVPTPKFWVADTREQIVKLEQELVFPLVLKPILGHKFSRKFTGAYAVARNLDELLRSFDRVCCEGIQTFLVEMIPGADDQLCSYYTYLDENGNSLIDFTKRVIRRYPMNMGGSTYHITDHVPDIRDLALALFRHVGLRGVANVEFKMDHRDGMLKLIECNARFTAADCLLAASGLNLSLFVYNRLTGHPHPAPTNYRLGMRLWKPVGDFAAYRELNKIGLLTFGAWLRSIVHRQVFPVFRWNDPLPSIVANGRLIRHAWFRFWHSPPKRDTVAFARRRHAPQLSDVPPATLVKPDISVRIKPMIELPPK